MVRTRFSPALNCWYLPFCSACTGSTRAAFRAGMNAATTLVITPSTTAKIISAGLVEISSAFCAMPKTSPNSAPM